MKTSALVIKLTYPILLLALLAAGTGVSWQKPGSPSEITTLRGEIWTHLVGISLGSLLAQSIAHRFPQ